ncbi:MAG TPA: hypothetical protein DIW47_06560 [Bacteroidetes bacterium]|nr:hypothetical protein [Bacteroidota bacterium]
MVKIIHIALLISIVIVFFSCSDKKQEPPFVPDQQVTRLPHARFFVVDSQAYSLVGNTIIHQKQVVFQTERSILTAEYDPETKLLAVLGTRHVLLIDPQSWLLLDQIDLGGQPIHLKARKGKIMVLTKAAETLLSVYQPHNKKLALVSGIQKGSIRDFACNRSHIALVAADSLYFLDQNLNPVSTLPFEGGTAIAMSDSVLYAKQPKAIWEYRIQNNQLNEGTHFY